MVAFEKSDLFFLCVLRPLTSAITKQDSELTDVQVNTPAHLQSSLHLEHFNAMSAVLTKTMVGIGAGQWMPLAEYRSQDYFKQRKLLKKMLDVCIAKAESGYKGFGLQDMQAVPKTRKPQYFYYNKVDCQG